MLFRSVVTTDKLMMQYSGRFKRLIPVGLRDKIYVWRKAGLSLILLNHFIGMMRRGQRIPFSLHFTSQIIEPEKIKFVSDRMTLTSFAVSASCYIQANNGVEIGRNFLFAPGVKLISSNHDLVDRRKKYSEPIRIGNDVWLGAGAIILPGVQLGDLCTVGAGSVVTKSFTEKGLVIAGNPARVIRETLPNA